MQHLTNLERSILETVVYSPAACWKAGVFRLSTQLMASYPKVYYGLKVLAALGLVDVTRPNGYRLLITSSDPHKATAYLNHSKYQSYRGSVPQKSKFIVHRAKTGGTAMTTIDQLRTDYSAEPSQPYPRPRLTQEEETKYAKIAKKVNSIRDDRLRLIYIAKMIEENVMLVKEANDHRTARGLEPLPEYDPEKTK